jgi:DNA-binding CsgD family transcriptional regulator
MSQWRVTASPTATPTFCASNPYSVARQTSPRGDDLQAVVRDPELLERERELQALDAMIAAACRGEGRLIAVEGPAGIGKTRLLVEARAQAQARMRVLVARGSQLEQDFAYGVVRQLFEPVLASAGQAERDDLLVGAAAQAAVLFDQVDAAAGGGDISFALLHGLFWLTANLAQRPLMLVVDDLHWSDGPSLRFLAYLLPRLEGLPLLVAVGLRPAELTVEHHLLAHVTTDPLARMVRLAPLSEEASAQLVRTVLAGKAEDAFCLACHTATGGNPLLLRELADAAAAEGLEATAAGAARLHEIGPQAVKRRVALRLTQLGPPAVAFCGALAILGDGVNPAHVAHLAGLEPTAAQQTARQLIDIEILHQSQLSLSEAPITGRISFVHPLVRAAVYEGLTETARLYGHARAARLLAAAGEAPERVAAHLLLIPPAGDSFVVDTLRRAADQVFARGSPDSAVSYLERCLQEPPDKERADVLLQLGAAAQLIDAAKSADYLAAAMAAADDPERRVVIAEMLGITLFNAGRGREAAEVMSQAIQALSMEHSDLRKRLQALLIHTALVDPARSRFGTETVSKLRGALSDNDLGSRMLDVTVAFHDLLVGNSSETAVVLARRGLGDGSLIEQLNPLSVYGCYVLIAADLNEVVPLLDRWIAVAHQRGSMFALAPAKCFRGLAWLSRGALAEAEGNLRDSLWAVMTTSQQVGVPVVAAYLADTLMERGNLDEAEAVLKVASRAELPQAGYGAWLLGSRARLLTLQGRIQEGLQTWLACGRRFAAHGGQNPAVLAWRSGAALALHRLDRGEEARELVGQEIILARRWGAPTALGRALRVAGLICGGEDGLELLRESTTILAASPARLEYAKALVDLGAALRRAGRRSESRQQLRLGVELAQICGATPLLERGWTELRVSGARPRHVAPSGPDALTPSERRVAELAAAGYTNRDIAQMLFITTNTVEVHLTRTYRKLGVNGRANLTSFSFIRSDERPTAVAGGGN